MTSRRTRMTIGVLLFAALWFRRCPTCGELVGRRHLRRRIRGMR